MEELVKWLEINSVLLGALASIAAIATLFFVNGGQMVGALLRSRQIEEKRSAQQKATRQTPEGRVVVGILPLDVFGGDAHLQGIANGIVEDVLTSLAHAPGLSVLSRNSTFRRHDHHKDLMELGQELGARYLVEGSVRPMGDTVRVTVQLVDTVSDSHLWADRQDVAADMLVATQDMIARRIASSLEPQIMRAEIERLRDVPPEKLTVWELVHRAFGPLLMGLRYENSTRESVSLMRRALKLDPNNARAHAVLGWALSNLNSGMNASSAGVHPELGEAMTHALKAVDLSRDDPLVMYCFGAVLSYVGRLDDSVQILQRAHELNPNDAQILAFLGATRARNGDLEGGQNLLEEALQLSPRDPRKYLWHNYVGWVRLFSFDFGGALAAAEQCLQQHAEFVGGWHVKALAHVARDEMEKAADAVQQIDRVSPGYFSKAEIIGGPLPVFISEKREEVIRVTDKLRHLVEQQEAAGHIKTAVPR